LRILVRIAVGLDTGLGIARLGIARLGIAGLGIAGLGVTTSLTVTTGLLLLLGADPS